MLYKRIIIFLIIIICNDAYCQPVYRDSTNGKPFRHKNNRNVFWFTPSNANQINGIAFGIWTMPLHQKKQIINGLNIEVPFPWVIPAICIGFIPVGLPVNTYRYHPEKLDDIEKNFFNRNDSGANEVINGLDLSIGALGKRKSRGLSVNVITAMYLENDGVSISVLSNLVNHFNGILIATVGNVSNSGSGIQIGLFNSCVNCSGLQIGLFNQNGDKLMPVVNYRSRKKAQKIEQEKRK